MKPLLIALTVLSSFFTMSSFTGDERITPQVLKSFENFFTNAEEVKWSRVQHLYLAEFSINGQNASAFYDPNGSMVACARHITTQQLPILLQADLKQFAAAHKLGTYKVIELFELNNDDGIKYYATIETESKRLLVKSNAENEWIVYKKSKK